MPKCFFVINKQDSDSVVSKSVKLFYSGVKKFYSWEDLFKFLNWWQKKVPVLRVMQHR